MESELRLLLRLQVIDYDLGELERSKEYLPDMMDNLSREMREVENGLATASSELEQARLTQKNLELDIQAKEADLQKFQQQMMTIKTNREYDALVAQIDAVKAEISAQETRSLETMDEISDLEKDIVEHRERLKQVNDNNTSQLGILQEKIDSIGDKKTIKESERREIVMSIPKQVMLVYERVRRGKGGTAVVAVKHRACGACYKALTPKKIQEIRKGNRILTCDNCGRLLFWDDNESG